MYYSAQTGGFYSREIHGDAIPSDAIEISDATHAALMEGQAQGKRIAPGPAGGPVLIDAPAPSFALQRGAELDAFRELREGYLNRLTGIALAAQVESDADTLSAALAMRRGLLDMTEAPAVLAATNLEGLQAALKSEYAALVAQVPAKLRDEFRKVGA